MKYFEFDMKKFDIFFICKKNLEFEFFFGKKDLISEKNIVFTYTECGKSKHEHKKIN